ncbi:MAG: hypothetical protein MJ252_23695 [archaeon]|nr:hypothetical protein [archaeon]
MERYIPPRKSNSKIANWSKKLWEEKKGIKAGIIFNLFCLYVFRTKQTIFSVLILAYIVYLLVSYFGKSLAGKEQPKEIKEESNLTNFDEGFKESLKSLRERLTYSYNTVEEVLGACLVLYEIILLTHLFPDIFFVWVIGNLCIFYYPLDKAFPDCIYKFYLAVVQTAEGIIGLIECLIPRYEETEEAKKEDIKK